MDSIETNLGLLEGRIEQGADNFSQLDVMPIAAYITNTAGQITYFNPAAEKLWGRKPTLGADKWCGSWDIFTTEGEFLPHDQCPMAEAIRSHRPVRGVEAIGIRPDGSRYRFMPFPTPLYDQGGLVVGAINVLLHLTEEPNCPVYVPRIAMIERSDILTAQA